MTETHLIRQRATALLTDGENEILLVQCDPGETIFDDRTSRPLGMVMNGRPVISGRTVYLSTNDYLEAKNRIPNKPKESRH